jgi:hypothetical protein
MEGVGGIEAVMEAVTEAKDGPIVNPEARSFNGSV